MDLLSICSRPFLPPSHCSFIQTQSMNDGLDWASRGQKRDDQHDLVLQVCVPQHTPSPDGRKTSFHTLCMSRAHVSFHGSPDCLLRSCPLQGSPDSGTRVAMHLFVVLRCSSITVSAWMLISLEKKETKSEKQARRQFEKAGFVECHRSETWVGCKGQRGEETMTRSWERNTLGLRAHAQQKAVDTARRTEAAIAQLLKEQCPVNFKMVAETAGISTACCTATKHSSSALCTCDCNRCQPRKSKSRRENRHPTSQKTR
jgi:hypothetical protein